MSHDGMIKKADSCDSVFAVSGYVNAPLALEAAAIIFPVPIVNAIFPSGPAHSTQGLYGRTKTGKKGEILEREASAKLPIIDSAGTPSKPV